MKRLKKTPLASLGGIPLASFGLAAFTMLGCCLGCYTVHNSVPSHIKTIAIPIFRNESLEAGLEDLVTRQVTERFQSNNTLAIADQARADALVDGVIKGYENRVYRFDDQEQAQEYVVILVANVTVRDRKKNKDLWTQEGIRTSATYAITGPQARPESDARAEAVGQLADILLSRTVEGW